MRNIKWLEPRSLKGHRKAAFRLGQAFAALDTIGAFAVALAKGLAPTNIPVFPQFRNQISRPKRVAGSSRAG